MEAAPIDTSQAQLGTLRALNAILDYASLDAEDIGAHALTDAINAAREIASAEFEAMKAQAEAESAEQVSSWGR